MLLVEFLKLVLPNEGKKCWVQIDKNKKVTQGFTDSFEALAEKVQAISRAGHDAYFACATFKKDSTRRTTNALACKAFWLDIDCGEGKPYASADIGLQALDAFADTQGLPYPFVVYSGAGLHAYWVLADSIAVNDWLPIAQSLKAVCANRGLHADPSRTADAASILRPPGTLNYKRAPAEFVKARDDEIETISAKDFVSKIRSPVVPQVNDTQHIIAGVCASILASRPKLPITEGVAEGGRNAACAQLVGAALKRGIMPGEILLEARAWNQKNLPPMEDREVCAVVSSIVRREAAKPASALISGDYPSPSMPKSFELRRGKGLWQKYKEKDGVVVEEQVTPYELYLKDVCRSEHNIKGSYIFSQFHPHNGWHDFAIDAKDFYSASWLSLMADNTAIILDERRFRYYVKAADINMREMKMDAIRYEQFGWKGGYKAFLIGTALIKNDGVTEFAYGAPKLESRMQQMRLAAGTTLNAWTVAANRYYAPGFETMGVGLLAGFAAPLMELVGGVTEGGAILSLYSEDSGFGKSNTLQGIASIWGPWSALTVGGQDTVNSKFAIISRLKNIVVCEEELGKMDPFEAANYVKRFTAGRDKNRAKRDGSVDANESNFHTIMVSASNNSLYDIVKQSGDQGALARILELEVDMPEDKEAFKEYTQIANTMLYNAGHAGRHYMHYLMRPGVFDAAQKRLAELVKHYQALLITSGKDRYVTYLLATMHCAAEITTKLEILSFHVPRIMEWVIERAKERVADKITQSAAEILNQFIIEHNMDCLIVEEPFNANKTTNVLRFPLRNLMMRMEKTTQRLYIPAQALRQWCADKNHNFIKLQRELEHESIVLNRNRITTLTAGTDFPPARLPCWEVALNCKSMKGGLAIEAGTDIAEAQFS